VNATKADLDRRREEWHLRKRIMGEFVMVRQGLLLLGVMSLSATGCSTMNNTQKGALVGGGVGSLVGTAIGAATGNPRTGAVLGAAGGSALGAIAGNSEDRRDNELEKAELRQAAANAQAQAAQQAAQLGMADVMELTRQGVDPSVIVNQIRSTNSTFNLTTSDIQLLTQQQVSPTVIRAMQESRVRNSPVRERVIYRESPVIVERPVVPVYGPPIYGPPAVGFHYSHVRVR
jgi:Glycine zipper